MKLNLFLYLNPESKKIAVDLNRSLNDAAGEGVISFSGERPAIPHVTVAMGDLKRDKTVDSLRDFLSNNIDKWRFRRSNVFDVERIYLEDMRDRYVFLDFITDKEFEKSLILARTSLFSYWFDRNYKLSSKPHLTLGYTFEPSLQFLDAIEALDPPESIGFDGLGLGTTGPKGTVVEILWERAFE